MIDRSNDLPRREGFWCSADYPNLPMPVADDKPWPGKDAFLIALAEKEKSVQPTLYRGVSLCRICNGRTGNAEFELGGWVWPDGFAHYVTMHHVRPSLAFQEFVVGKETGKKVWDDPPEAKLRLAELRHLEPWRGQEDFAKALTWLQTNPLVKMNIDPRGKCRCPICGDGLSAVGTYSFNNWKWSMRFVHDVEKHNGHPEVAFLKFVMYLQCGK